MKKKLVFLTGSGISAESGISTFRDANGLWENYNVQDVCTNRAIAEDPDYVNEFYNMLRTKYCDAKPNKAHTLIGSLENSDEYQINVITQNVDNLHEQAGSKNVLHLHGDIMKCCSSKSVENKDCWVSLPQPGFGESGLEIPKGEKAKDGSPLRPYIVFFGENVPNMVPASEIVRGADILIIIGTSMQVYPAASLIDYFGGEKVFVIDPSDVQIEDRFTTHIKEKATVGMEKLIKNYLINDTNEHKN
jgi:NAD-dependent deacetylase